MRVLLVDDEMELVTTLAERLSIRGIETDWATNADDAMELVKAHAYDIAVLDMKMPGVNGLELMQMIAPVRPEMKYLFLTGHGSEQEYEEASSAGARFYLMKPVNIDALMEKLKEAVE